MSMVLSTPALAHPAGTAARRLLFLGCALALAGCASMAPPYERPAPPLPGQFADNSLRSDTSAYALDWRTYFADPALQQLITQALAHNHDLRLAVLFKPVAAPRLMEALRSAMRRRRG